MKKNILLLYLSFFIVGCKQPEKKQTLILSEPYFVTLNPANMSDNGPRMSDIFSEIEYIQLELNKDHLVGEIAAMVCTEDFIFVHTERGHSELLQFSRDGRFVRMIGSNGRGPGEYIGIRSVAIDEVNQKVIILNANHLGELISYNFDGTYLETTRIHFPDGTTFSDPPITRISIFNEDHLFAEGAIAERYLRRPLNVDNYKAYYILSRSNGEIVFEQESDLYDKKRYNVKKDRSNALSVFHSFWKDDQGRLNYWEYASDTVRIIGQNFELGSKIIFEQNLLTPTFAQLSNDNRGGFAHLVKLPNKVVKNAVYDTPRYIFVDWCYQNSFVTSAFDKLTGMESFCMRIPTEGSNPNGLDIWRLAITNGGPQNDIDGGLSIRPKTVQNDYWLYVLQPIEMIEAITNERLSKAKYPEKAQRLRSLMSTLREDDNPIIMLAKLKKLDEYD